MLLAWDRLRPIKDQLPYGPVRRTHRWLAWPRYWHFSASRDVPLEYVLRTTAGCRRDGVARTGLQYDARHEHHGHQTADSGDEGVVLADMRPSAVADPCACRKSNTHIQMMESAEKWRRHNATNGMYCSRHLRVLVD
jgi:hypothetical protein